MKILWTIVVGFSSIKSNFEDIKLIDWIYFNQRWIEFQKINTKLTLGFSILKPTVSDSLHMKFARIEFLNFFSKSFFNQEFQIFMKIYINLTDFNLRW